MRTHEEQEAYLETHPEDKARLDMLFSVHMYLDYITTSDIDGGEDRPYRFYRSEHTRKVLAGNGGIYEPHTAPAKPLEEFFN